MAKDRPHKDKHDEDIVRMAEEGSRKDLQEAVQEMIARDAERSGS